jgi:hypothetical protein
LEGWSAFLCRGGGQPSHRGLVGWLDGGSRSGNPARTVALSFARLAGICRLVRKLLAAALRVAGQPFRIERNTDRSAAEPQFLGLPAVGSRPNVVRVKRAASGAAASP